MKRAEHTITVDATPQACFDVLADFEGYPSWQRGVHDAQVLAYDRDGRALEVRFDRTLVRRYRYSLVYGYEEPHRIWWEYGGGDLKNVEGEIALAPRTGGATAVTYSIGFDPGVWVPGPIERKLHTEALHRWLEDLRRRVVGLEVAA
jgi:uncharacterized membrane protein